MEITRGAGTGKMLRLVSTGVNSTARNVKLRP
jgi:hypothetical protein